MTLQVKSLRKFNYLTIIQTPFEKIYRLLYPKTVRFLRVEKDGNMVLMESNGSLITGEILNQLYEKIVVYERLFNNSLDYEKIEYFLRINEVKFLLEELEMNQPVLEKRLYNRLIPHVQNQIIRRFYKPLLLSKIIVNNEFVFNYLQTNIGHPDGSENYFNRMKIMIQQISEHTQYVEVKNYFEIIRSILIYVNTLNITTPNIVIQSFENYCVLKSGFETIKDKYYRFLEDGKAKLHSDKTTVIHLDNRFIASVISVYNSLTENIKQ